jgi:hypothetical protein
MPQAFRGLGREAMNPPARELTYKVAAHQVHLVMCNGSSGCGEFADEHIGLLFEVVGLEFLDDLFELLRNAHPRHVDKEVNILGTRSV